MNKKINRENKTIYLMIKMYCNYHHHTNKLLCTDCRAIYNYAEKRTAKCIFGTNKPLCAQCPVHCYKIDMRKKIREIMRFSGPKMIFKYPVQALHHIIRKYSPTSQVVKNMKNSKIKNNPNKSVSKTNG
ncbi:MAG: nitrous oxide-stimulated promoter family protein [Chlorobi bacterium]|nr:nitrous oxide-stimulated promoter family protein [Chlorobiota bacterium]